MRSRKTSCSKSSTLKFAKPQVETNPAYIEWIKTLCCCVTGSRASSVMSIDPHHVPLKGHGKKGGKTDDTRAIPLRHDKHVETHNMGRESFAEKYGLNYELLIAQLNKKWEEINGKENDL